MNLNLIQYDLFNIKKKFSSESIIVDLAIAFLPFGSSS